MKVLTNLHALHRILGSHNQLPSSSSPIVRNREWLTSKP